MTSLNQMLMHFELRGIIRPNNLEFIILQRKGVCTNYLMDSKLFKVSAKSIQSQISHIMKTQVLLYIT